MSKNSSVYKTTLGDKTLNRARIIFAAVLVVVLLIIGTTIFAESKTGELRKKLTQPFNNLVSLIESAFNEDTTPAMNNQVNVFTYSNSVSSTSSKIVTPTPKKTTTVSKPSVTQTQTQTQAPTKNFDAEYQAALKKQEEWAAQQKAAGDQRMKDLQTKSQSDFDAWRAKQQAELDAWKKANGF